MNHCPICPAAFATSRALGNHRRWHAGPTDAERFDRYLDKAAGLLGCWLYTGDRFKDGYGKFWMAGKTRRANRVALEFALGRPLGLGMQAMHWCDNPPCCNPAHLFEGTNADNVEDRHRKVRDAAGETNGNARLVAGQVVAARARVAEGESRVAVARDLGVSSTTVDRLVAGKNWSQVA